MSIVSTATRRSALSPNWISRAHDLGRNFAARAAAADAADAFVAENYAELKATGFIAAGVPVELGGGGATHEELAEVLRVLAGYCPSTALALSMHTHQVLIAVWRWLYDKAPVEGLLRRVAAENIVLVSSGGSDWLPGSGRAERVEGGFRVSARKVFSSGAPAGDLLMTGAVYDDPQAGPTVLHFAVPLKASEVKLLDTWHTLGMRGTGSQDIAIDGFFVADAAVGGKRPQGKWHRLFYITSMIAFPLVYGVYLGVAEAARERALVLARTRRADEAMIALIGEMDRELLAARLAHRHMMATAAGNDPGPANVNAIMAGRVLAGQACIRVVEKAMEVAGGASFYRENVLERLFRDVQGARFHPLQDKPQARLAGRLALGLEIDG